jgi:transposase InsO family protein
MAEASSPKIEQLESDNYAVWSTRMRALLEHKDLWDVIENEVPPHADAAILKKNRQARAIIVLHLTDQLLVTVGATSTAKELWDAFAATYRAKSTARRQQLRRSLAKISKRPDETLTAYFNRACKIRDDLLGVGHSVDEDTVVGALMSGLPESYNIDVAILESSLTELKLDDVFAKLLLAEQRQEERGGTDVADSSAMMAKSKKWKRKAPFEKREVKDLRCWRCGKSGHKQADCRVKLSGQTRGPQTSFAFMTNSEGVNEDRWILDSGASQHMAFNRCCFSKYSPLPECSVSACDGKRVNACGVGEVKLQTVVNGRVNEVTLKNVLHVPKLVANLIAASRVDEAGAKLLMTNGQCLVTVNEIPVMLARSVNGIYEIEVKRSRCLISTSNRDAAALWHRRFGHLGYENLQRLVKEKMVTGLPVSPDSFGDEQKKVCEPCIMAKQHRHSHTSPSKRISSALELVHMDVMGPLQEPSFKGCRYIATFLDDHSKFSIARGAVSKGDVPTIVKDTILLLENQVQAKVRAVKTDRGTEYLNASLRRFFSSKGILHQLSPPHTPEQNGAAERLNRTLMEKARAMLLESGLPTRLWLEAVMTSNYVRNRSPVAGLSETPFERLFGKKPVVSHLRVFGSTAYALKPKQGQRKLDARSQKVVFVGYDAASYRLWIPGTDKVLVRCDVIFDEDLKSPVSRGITRFPEDDMRTNEEVIDEEPVGDNEGANAQVPAEEEMQEASEDEEPRYPKRARNPPTEWYRVQTPRVHMAVVPEPTTMQEAMSSANASDWQEAVNSELRSLEENKTWELVSLPYGQTPIPCKWVFKVKKDAQGNIERFKARLVVKGYAQRPGIDFDEVYAPVSKHATLRALLAKVAVEDLELHQFDVKTAFLNGELEEEIYMKPPEGLQVSPGKVCRLVKSLYGLRQAPRAWHTKLKEELSKMGFVASQSDAALFIHEEKNEVVYMLVYVDDILVAAKSPDEIDQFKKKFLDRFEARDLGDASFFLGMEIVRDRRLRTIGLNQGKFAQQLVEKFSMQDAKPASTPSSTAVKISAEGSPLDTVKFPYSELVGSLLYLAVCTRPDIAQAVGAVARYLSKPTVSHWNAVHMILRYVKGTVKYGLMYGHGDLGIIGYCDADYAGDIDTRRSTTGYAFVMNGGVISWNSRLQATVAASTVEAEYMAAAAAVKEALWLRKLMQDLGCGESCITIKDDNQGALKILKHPISSARSKHIDVLHHFARERVQRGEVTFEYLSTERMIADILTKPLPKCKFVDCCRGLGLLDSSSSSRGSVEV